MTRPLIAAASLLAAAAVADVLAHILGIPALEAPAHLATLAGMVATLAVVVINGLTKRRHTPEGSPRP